MRVLIVDDEVLVRKGISMGIKWDDLGFKEVHESRNGLEALEYAKEHYPHLVITDIKMPKMDGHELIEQLKIYCPDTIVIVLSCINDMDSVRKAMKFGGAVDYIPKLSISTEDLADIVKKCKKQMKPIDRNGDAGTKEGKTTQKKVYLTKEREQRLKEAIGTQNNEAAKKVIQIIFDDLSENSASVDRFKEWHELISILSGSIKKIGGNINELKMNNLNIYDYFNGCKNLYEMKERFFALLDRYFNYIEEYQLKRYGEEIGKTIQYLHLHYKDAIKLNEVAQHIGINDTYLCKLFKKETGKNFTDYLNEIRIQKAKELLVESNEPIYAIAELVGYNSESYFSRTFKKIENMSPKAYRRSHK
ncbi:response regulator transcription factor [Vallitalea okinawensis]|uniref:response regulator transcription factor n=1 Tax=Vallitalea okinawensis TaxID=2078660 RepID=UPI001300B6D9|nr:helix-turn-helix domain-containing protein [Vallitalea okinawensis]